MFTTRKKIRDAIVDVLKNETLAQERVFPNRISPVNLATGPVINVYTASENKIAISKDERGTIHRRDLVVKVEIVTETNSESASADSVDELSYKVEDLIEESNKLGGIVKDIQPDQDELGLGQEGNRPQTSWIMSFNVVYIRLKE